MKRHLNQKGQAMLLSVIVFSIVMVTSLIAAYVYTENRIRFYAQIKEAYKLAEATEGAAKSIKSVWDQATTRVASGAVNCAAPPCTPDTFFTEIVMPMLPANLCFDNVDSPNQYCFNVAQNQIRQPTNKLEMFVAKLDGFFRKQYSAAPASQNVKRDMLFAIRKPHPLDWILHEGMALATNEFSDIQSVTESEVIGGDEQTPSYVNISSSSIPNCKTNPGSSASCGTCNTNSTSAMGTGNGFNQQSRCVGVNFGGFNQAVRIGTVGDRF